MNDSNEFIYKIRFLLYTILQLLRAALHMGKRVVGGHIEGLWHILAAGALASKASLAAEIRLKIHHIAAVNTDKITSYYGAIKGTLIGVLELATESGILEGTHRGLYFGIIRASVVHKAIGAHCGCVYADDQFY
jgi:hypothetical protein